MTLRNNTVCIRAKIRGVSAPHNLESVDCFHIGIQGTGSDSPVQGDRKTGRVPGAEVLAVVLACGGTGRAADPNAYNE